MRYIKYYPAWNADHTRIIGVGCDTEEECQRLCSEENRNMVAAFTERQEWVRANGGEPASMPTERILPVKVTYWQLLGSDIVAFILFTVFVHQWVHGRYHSAWCALGLRIMLFGLPIVGVKPFSR